MGINVTAEAALGRKEQGTGKLGKSQTPRSPSQALSLPHSDSQANGVLDVKEVSHHGTVNAATLALKQRGLLCYIKIESARHSSKDFFARQDRHHICRY
jgi:hypothetical protein